MTWAFNIVDYVWQRMNLMRRLGCTQVEGEIRQEGDVTKAEVKAVFPKPAEFIVLDFKLPPDD